MATKKKQTFPEELLVTTGEDGSDKWYVAWESCKDIEDEEIVGIYKFESMARVRKDTVLEDIE